jgi:hypothetical protein
MSGAVDRGGCDGRPDKVDAWIPALKISPRKMEAATLESTCHGAHSGCWTGWYGAIWRGLRLMMCVG